jgi:hypothetical protein
MIKLSPHMSPTCSNVETKIRWSLDVDLQHAPDKVTTPKWDTSRSATNTLSTKPDTVCLQTGHNMFAIRSKVTNGS